MLSNRDILKIVFPLIISGLGQSVIYVTDILFLGRLGEVALGASAIAGLFYASIIMIGFGISSGLQVIIAQKTGEGNVALLHQYLFNGILIQGLFSALFTWIYFLSRHILLELFVQHENVRVATIHFLDIRILGLFPYYLFYAYRAYYLGIGATKIISISTIVMSSINVLLNPILIYGWESYIQPLNYLGSAWASVLSEWMSTLLIMLYYAYQKKAMQFISYLKWTIIKAIIRISTPLIFQHFISVFSWFLFFLFIEKMGTSALAVSNVIRAVYILIMAPVLAFSHSTITIIGQLFGAQQFNVLKPTLLKICKLSVFFTLPFSIFSLMYPTLFMKIFTNDPTLLAEGKSVMRVISFALVYFALSMPVLSAVTGLGETKKALLTESISFVVYILSSAFLVFMLKLSLPFVWCNEFIYFSCISFISYYFFTSKIRVLINKESHTLN